MSKNTSRSTEAGIVRPVWEGPRARPDRIAVFKLTGFPAIGEAFSAAFKIPPELPRLWKVQVGNRAHVATEDLGRIHSVHTFAEATALADEIRRRGEAFHRLERMMPSRLRPRPGRRVIVGPLPGSVAYLDEAQLLRAPGVRRPASR